LLALAYIEGVATGTRVEVPLLKDILAYGQFFVAIPILLLAEVMIGKRVGWAVSELRRSDILAPEDHSKLDQLLVRVIRRWRGRGVTVVLLVLTLAVTLLSIWAGGKWLTGGWQEWGGRMTLPGWWYQLVSLPVLRFLALRWLWRLVLWTLLLWRISALKLRPNPAHPDRAGGLAFLGGAQTSFGWLVLALGVQVSCLVADAVYYQGTSLMSFKLQIVAFVLIVMLGMLLPLIVFVPKLVYAREAYLIYLSGKGYEGVSRLERKLNATAADEWPNDDVSGMCDYSTLYENARLMRPIPLEIHNMLMLVVSAILPFVPLVFLVMPAQEVLKTLAKLLI
jgi:hypothetical protein